MEITESKPKNKIGLGAIVSWGLGGILVVGGIIELFSKPVMGVFTLLAGLVIFPPAVTLIKDKTNFELSKGLKILAFLVLLGIGGALSGTSSSTNPSVNTGSSNNAQPTATTQPEKPKQWVTVIEASGNANKNTDTFELTGGKTKITYSFSGDAVFGAIYFLKEGTDLMKQGGIPEVTISSEGNDSTFITKSAGKYYLSVKSANTSWTVKVEEER